MMTTIVDLDGVFTVADILRDAVAKNSQDTATVYRFLTILTQAGVLREVGEIERVMHYEMACQHHPEHAHFLCEHCHRITCLDPLTFGDAVQLFRQAPAHRVKRVSVILNGLCADCAGKEKP